MNALLTRPINLSYLKISLLNKRIIVFHYQLKPFEKEIAEKLATQWFHTQKKAHLL